MRLTLREFRKSDVVEVQGPEYEMEGPALGLTAVDGVGAVMAYALVWHVNGRDWLCFWHKPDMPRAAMMLHRSGTRFIKALKGMDFAEIYTICGLIAGRQYGEGADRWMTRLGFTPLAVDEKDFEIREYERQKQGECYKLWLR